MNKKVVTFPTKKPVQRAASVTANNEHHLNLRCPEGDYYAKTTRGMLRRGRLVCPIHGIKLETKSERGEHRGRKAS